MRMSDWSSDVCSSDLADRVAHRDTSPVNIDDIGGDPQLVPRPRNYGAEGLVALDEVAVPRRDTVPCARLLNGARRLLLKGIVGDGPLSVRPDLRTDRKSVVWGQLVSDSVDLVG